MDSYKMDNLELADPKLKETCKILKTLVLSA